MQAFYDRLAHSKGNSYMRVLARLTRARLVQMAALRSTLSWSDWSAQAE
ncbi:MAG: hypothetical protein L0332_16235 [Chloroflexi bacterium]|nr:hypothetical protein [Chloroflexota bacterium]MCI0577680.1 hypothetical protein [Chloroflexota bacterium]MCI0644600.1 hypothetical protein [Chloroflexota bacterium]MCI0728250.1 hypothetical protein [Chloroflexota bacterium]